MKIPNPYILIESCHMDVVKGGHLSQRAGQVGCKCFSSSLGRINSIYSKGWCRTAPTLGLIAEKYINCAIAERRKIAEKQVLEKNFVRDGRVRS